MNIEKSLQKLYSLHTFGIKLGLDNITRFLEFIGNPQKEFKAFHIAGSNGKGSTASFIASILMELNYQVGLYTSPHFVKFNERIKINNAQIPDYYIAGFISGFEKYIDENQLTFFEVTTAMAFMYFMEQNVDYTVIETGLGGRLDATNVLNPLSAVITSISLEHTSILGNSIKEIAAEKAGIIKKSSKVFIGNLPDDAVQVIENKCEYLNCELFKLKEYITEENNSLEFRPAEPGKQFGKMVLNDTVIPLKGLYQKYNAALSGLTVYKTLNLDDYSPLFNGFKSVLTNTGFQGRFEFYKKNPDIIFDSAHNPEGIKSFINEFKKDYHKYSRRTLLFGVMKDKAVEEMLFDIKDYFDEIYITEIDIERSCKVEDLLKIASKLNLHVKITKEPVKLITEFEIKTKDNCLVVLGSMYLIGEIKSKLINILT